MSVPRHADKTGRNDTPAHALIRTCTDSLSRLRGGAGEEPETTSLACTPRTRIYDSPLPRLITAMESPLYV